MCNISKWGDKIKQVWSKEKWSENEKMCSDVFCICMLHCGLLDIFRVSAQPGRRQIIRPGPLSIGQDGICPPLSIMPW